MGITFVVKLRFVGTRIEPKTLKAIDELAARLHGNRAQALRLCIEEGLKVWQRKRLK